MAVQCTICNGLAAHRRIRVNLKNGKYQFAQRLLCQRCDALLRRKPSSSRRGRKRDRVVSAPSTEAWIDALRRSWSITGDCFRCEISGLKLEMEDRHQPLAWTCDHNPPGSDKILIVAWIINDMKNDHDRDEFVRNITALAEILESGKPDPSLADAAHDGFAKLNHWRRR